MTELQTIQCATGETDALKKALKVEERRGNRLEKELAVMRGHRDNWFKEREKELDNIEVLQKRIAELQGENSQLRAKLEEHEGEALSKVYELDLPGYDENAGEGDDGVLWLVLSESQAKEIGQYAERLGKARFCEIEEQPDELGGALDYDGRESAQMDALVERLDNEIADKHYPIGTRLISLCAELDDDENGNERLTPVGSEWVVTGREISNGTHARHLHCEATGAWIIPFIDDIDRQFKVKRNEEVS